MQQISALNQKTFVLGLGSVIYMYIVPIVYMTSAYSKMMTH